MTTTAEVTITREDALEVAGCIGEMEAACIDETGARGAGVAELLGDLWRIFWEMFMYDPGGDLSPPDLTVKPHLEGDDENVLTRYLGALEQMQAARPDDTLWRSVLEVVRQAIAGELERRRKETKN